MLNAVSWEPWKYPPNSAQIVTFNIVINNLRYMHYNTWTGSSKLDNFYQNNW